MGNEITDQEILIWIHDRLQYTHNENPRIDYMHKLRAIIAEYPADKVTPQIGQGKNSMDELKKTLLANNPMHQKQL